MTSIVTVFTLSIGNNHINIRPYNDIFAPNNDNIVTLSSNHVSILDLTI
jgi:hypothetical protein